MELLDIYILFFSSFYFSILTFLKRKAFEMTETELKLIANAAIIGDNSKYWK